MNKKATEALAKIATLSMGGLPKNYIDNSMNVWDAFTAGREYQENYKKPDLEESLCENCDPIKMPLCNKCLGV